MLNISVYCSQVFSEELIGKAPVLFTSKLKTGSKLKKGRTNIINLYF